VFQTKTIKYSLIVIEKYQIILTSSFIKIGCQLHKVEEWEDFDDRQIKVMGNGALEWWKIWKDFILTAQKTLPETFNES